MIFHMRVGADRTRQRTYDVRSPFQQQTVRDISQRDDFDFAFPNTGFDAGVGDYTGPFFFGWVDTEAIFHGMRIGSVAVLNEWTRPWDEMCPHSAARGRHAREAQ
jgi:hypothetical protein